MALIKCTECGKQFSDKAFACPNCGCPVSEIIKANMPKQDEQNTLVSPDSTKASLGESTDRSLQETSNHIGNTAKRQGKRNILRVLLTIAGVIAIAVVVLIVLLPRGFSENSKKITQAAQSVLTLYCYEDENAEYETDKWISSGSGFLLYDDSTIITNYHVIEGAKRVYAFSEEDKAFSVTSLSAYDKVRDVAILKTDKPTKLKALIKGDYKQLKKGDKVTAIGSPQGLKNIVTTGLYSGAVFTEAYNEDLLQFSASISEGSSGGALFDERGQLIGMTTASLTEGENLNFAVPEASIDDLHRSAKKTMSLAECIQAESPKNTPNKNSPYGGMPLDEAIASSKQISFNSYKNNSESWKGQNVHFSAYVVNTEYWYDKRKITLADTIQWPYETTEMSDYFGPYEGEGGEPFAEWQQKYEIWETIPKTPSTDCRLADSGDINGTPKEGDMVDVYFVVDQGSTEKINAYYIAVR